MTDAGGYKTTGDAPALAAAVGASGPARVLDVGCGAGGVALCMMDENSKLKMTGIDMSDKMLADASRNARLNGRDIELLKRDIFDWKTTRQFDFVVTNPPYFSGTPRRDNAHHNVDIYGWTSACVKRLRARGVFYCIVSTGVMDKVIAALSNGKCGGITVRVAPSDRVIISGRLGVKTGAKLLIDLCSNNKV